MSEADFWPVELRGAVVEARGGRLLDGVSLTLSPGPRTVLMGPNGAGKSLTLRILAGLIAPKSGGLSFAGGAARPGDFRRIALVFQRPVLLRRTVAANLAHALAVYGAPRAGRRARIAELLDLAGLARLADRPARVLSGGEQQRLALARALAAEPALLLLDEPTASLDPAATAAIEALVDRAAASGVKVVLVTHDVGQARRMADEVVFLDHGRVAETADAASFFTSPRSEAARAYLDGRLLV